MTLHLRAVHVPLSDGDRFRPLTPVRVYYDWSPVLASIVGIHVHGSWALALRVREKELDVELRRYPENEHDPNAVGGYVDGKQIGYLMAEAAADISPALARGLPLIARAVGEPYALSATAALVRRSFRRTASPACPRVMIECSSIPLTKCLVSAASRRAS